MLKVTSKLEIPLREFEFSFATSAGPGGQNVNKVATKATLRWPVTTSKSVPDAVRDRFIKKYARRINKEGDLVVTSQRFRNQGRNVADCIEKLREMLKSVAKAPKKRRKTKPSKAQKEKRLKDKKERSEKKQRRKRVGY